MIKLTEAWTSFGTYILNVTEEIYSTYILLFLFYFYYYLLLFLLLLLFMARINMMATNNWSVRHVFNYRIFIEYFKLIFCFELTNVRLVIEINTW